MLDTLKLSQHNTARGREILQSLFEVSLKEESDFIFVQEPYMFHHSPTNSFRPIHHPSYHLFPPILTTNLRPRVLTYLKKSSQLQVSPRFDLVSDPDLQILEVVLPSESFYVIHIYNEKPTSDYSTQLTLERFLDQQLKLDKPFLFLGDFNLHHPTWNPLVQNSTLLANRLVQYLDKTNAHLLNNSSVIEKYGGTFHRSNSKGTSIIDLTFEGGFRQLRWGNWKYGESTGSDHELIIFDCLIPSANSHSSSANNPLPSKFNIKKADWSMFRSQLILLQSQSQQQLEEAINNGNVELIAALLQSVVHTAASNSIPLLKITSRSKPWWTKELTSLRQRFHKLRRLQKWYPNVWNAERSAAARNKYFQQIQHTKKQHWYNFLAAAKEKMVFTAYSYSRPDRYQTSMVPTLIYTPVQQNPPVQATTFSDKCKALAHTLFPQTQASTSADSTEESMGSEITQDKFSAGGNCQWDWPELTMDEMQNALPKKITAPGLDCLDWTIIRKAMTIIPQFFFQVYHSLFKLGQHPSQWKNAVGIIIPKRNKKDYSAPKAYRPISLLPCLSKLLERIYSNRLSFLANTNCNLLHSSQFGGRKQRSAIDAALLLEEFIEKNLNKQRIVSTVFLDIMGAFDQLQPSRLINTLHSLQLPVTLISWVQSFLSDRTIQFLFNGQLSHEFPVTGTPQGSPISPILFLLSIRDLIPKVSKIDHLQLSYMDDISVSVSSTSVAKNLQNLKLIINELLGEAEKLSVTFEIEKSEFIHFCHRKEPPTSPLILNNNITLEPKEVVRWLGIWFDRRLNFKTHIDKRLQLANGALSRIRNLASVSRGLHCHALRQLYLACVTSVLDYGSILWHGRRGTSMLSNKCQKLQNQALTIITGAYKGSPIKALEVEASILPVKVRHQKQLIFYGIRILRLQRDHVIQEHLFSPVEDELTITNKIDLGLLDFIGKPVTQLMRIGSILKPLASLNNLEQLNIKWIPPWSQAFIHTRISTQSKEVTKDEHLQHLKSINLNDVIIYTDGSLSGTTGSSIGFVVYLPVTREMRCFSYNLGDSTGITDAETYCILKATLYANKYFTNKTIHIFTDSQASILRVKHSSNLYSHQIRLASKGSTVHLQWCPAHVGIEGNELADRLAKGGGKKSPLKRDKFTSHSFIKQKAREWTIQAWQRDWNLELWHEEEGRKAKGLGKYYRLQAQSNHPNFNTKLFNFQECSRETECGYFQARLGVGNTRVYLHMIGKVQDNMCNFCGRERQTVQHLLLHCPKFTKQRNNCFKGIEPRILPILFCTRKGKQALLKYLDTSKCMAAHKGN